MANKYLVEFHNELINKTVLRAYNGSAFYRKKYDGIDLSKIRNISELSGLPIITKKEIRNAGRHVLCKGLNVSHLQNTSGSTGEPLFIYRSVEESHFIREFFNHISTDYTCQKLKPIVLSLAIPHHGTPTPVPGNYFVVTSGVSDNELLEHTLALLRKTFCMPGIDRRVSILSGSHSQILALTNYLLENKYSPAEFNINAIQLTGRYLTSRWRNVLSQAWGAEVTDCYSLTEIFGGAILCKKCNGFHFEPYIVAELLKLSSDDVVQEGIGRLVLTSLFPFVQLHPFIRYFSGDVFSLTQNTCIAPRFEFLGRVNQVLIDPRNKERLILSAVDVLDIIDQLPENNRSKEFKDISGMNYHSASGRPRLKGKVIQQRSKILIELNVELHYTPMLFPENSRLIKHKIFNELILRSKELSEDINNGNAELKINLLSPGTLDPLIKETQLWDTN